jgi:lysine-specific demethylase 8
LCCQAGLTVLHRPTQQDFQSFFDRGTPVVLKNTIDEWPAMALWADFEALKERHGDNIVPVEIGNYMESTFIKSEIPLAFFIDYLQGNIEQDPSRPVYLAQHRLFEQIPELADDIMEPSFCALGKGDLYGVNAWFGPEGTVSPLHHDPYHNLLAQVIGEKLVRLYKPSSEHLYPHMHGVQRNTSEVGVDVEAPDEERFPLFSAVPYEEVVLQAGDVLFMPRGWWHFCRSKSVSFSVNHWWL